MATIQIKHVPARTHAVLRERAAKAGQSLQEYLLAELNSQAAQPTLDELFDEIEARDDGARVDVAEIVAVVRADRDRR